MLPVNLNVLKERAAQAFSPISQALPVLTVFRKPQESAPAFEPAGRREEPESALTVPKLLHAEGSQWHVRVQEGQE